MTSQRHVVCRLRSLRKQNMAFSATESDERILPVHWLEERAAGKCPTGNPQIDDSSAIHAYPPPQVKSEGLLSLGRTGIAQ